MFKSRLGLREAVIIRKTVESNETSDKKENKQASDQIGEGLTWDNRAGKCAFQMDEEPLSCPIAATTKLAIYLSGHS